MTLSTVSTALNELKLIKILFPNACCDSEVLRLYNKDIRLGPERIQEPGTYAHSYYVNSNDLHNSIRLRIRDRPLDTTPVDFTTYRSPGSDISEDDDESEDHTDKNVGIPAFAGAYPPSLASTMPSLALIPSFSEKNAGLALASIFQSTPADPTVQIFYRELNLDLVGQTAARDHVVAEVIYGTPVYHVRTAYHDFLLRTLCTLAHFLHCAGNDHNPYFDGNAPADLRVEALEENNTPLPGISLFLSYELPKGEELDDRTFLSFGETESYIIDLEQIINYFAHWMFNCAQNSLRLGINSVWNFGAPIGCATIITRRVEHILVINDDGNISSTIWPLGPTSYYDGSEEDVGDELMRSFLDKLGVGEGELNEAIIQQGRGDGLWQDVGW
ncbi:hypothetical protein K438DRAFT_1758060 [Mycena galopus ATCC 62051]|nr:hypothetical protein K438DRAFT_1758060 [Mycena galopus ATCC 62051]